MPPARQHLEAPQTSGLKIGDGLKVGNDLVGLKGPAKIGLTGRMHDGTPSYAPV